MGGTEENMQAWKVTVFGRTDLGRQRQNNEDTFLVADLTRKILGLPPEVRVHSLGPKGSLFIVADGMGGANAGEVASLLAVEQIHQTLESTWAGCEESGDGDLQVRLIEAVKAANREIKHRGLEDDNKRGMGSTCVAAAVVPGRAYLCNVGDSRGYLLRGGVATQLTHDQSFVQHLLDAGAITPEQAANSPRRNVVTEALGAREEVNVGEVAPVDLQHGDIILLCSDGLTCHAEPEDLVRVVHSTRDPIERCKRLIDLANERGGRDNVTVIVAEFELEGEPPVVRPEPSVKTDSQVSPTKVPGELAEEEMYMSISQTAQEVLAAETELSRIRSQSRRQSLLTGFLLGAAVGLVATVIVMGSQEGSVKSDLERKLGELRKENEEIKSRQSQLLQDQRRSVQLKTECDQLRQEVNRRTEESTKLREELVRSQSEANAVRKDREAALQERDAVRSSHDRIERRVKSCRDSATCLGWLRTLAATGPASVTPKEAIDLFHDLGLWGLGAPVFPASPTSSAPSSSPTPSPTKSPAVHPSGPRRPSTAPSAGPPSQGRSRRLR